MQKIWHSICKKQKIWGLTILPPDINQSTLILVLHNNALLFGLQGIKNVGMASLENIISERVKRTIS